MGNEKSVLSGLEIDEKAIEITDFWSLHSANWHGGDAPNLSIFVSEPSLHSTTNFGKPSPLERAAKNLMLHRHPCILKYVSSWRKGSSYYLATEEVKPLVQVIGTQTTLQICIGLHSILKALIFLHETALASHNNISSNSIYITSEGSWKLGGLEFLCKYTDFNQVYLKRIKTYRYEKAIAAEEKNSDSNTQINPVAIDQYAFGILIEEVLRLKNVDDVPSLSEFKELCRRNLQNENPLLRAKLSTILQHPFFTHDFINIHAFLMELPLKTEIDKEKFFSNLVTQLNTFPEKIVAEQLGGLLLSRMVFLDSTAQLKLLPHVLKPKAESDNVEDIGLFTISTFKSCLVPKLLQMFRVRDTSIRLLLLAHLSAFISAFQLDEVKNVILPELLVGIKDHDDHLVSETLQALAYLVPILGATTVIGGNRGKLFTDGRPNYSQTGRNIKTSKRQNDADDVVDPAIDPMILELPERPSPDGGEDGVESPSTFVFEESTWSDWDDHEVSHNGVTPLIPVVDIDTNVVFTNEAIDGNKNTQMSRINKTLHKINSVIPGVTELDIEHSKISQSVKEEVDFFMDMEPIIEKTKVLCVEEVKPGRSVFDVTVNNTPTDDDDGWGEDLNDDWGND